MVYNGNNMPPFAVPDNKTQSGIRGANWGDAGAADVSNELRFEDASGSEEIYLHAQKDFRRVVQHDDTLSVQTGNRTIDIAQGNYSMTLDLGAASTTAEQSITLTVGASSIKLDQTGITIKAPMISVEGDIQVDVKAPMITVDADATLTLKGGITMIN
jgi:type VI secretion system secreted protein VgrG